MKRLYRVYFIFSKTPKMRVLDVEASNPQEAIYGFVEKFNEEKRKIGNSFDSIVKSVFALQTEKGANAKVELLNGQRKSVSYYSVELDKAEKRSKETNITVEM